MNQMRLRLEEQFLLGSTLRSINTNVIGQDGIEPPWFQGQEKYLNVSLSKDGQDIRYSWGQTTEFEVADTHFPSSKLLIPTNALDAEFVRTVIGVLNGNCIIPILSEAKGIIQNRFQSLN